LEEAEAEAVLDSGHEEVEVDSNETMVLLPLFWKWAPSFTLVKEKSSANR